ALFSPARSGCRPRPRSDKLELAAEEEREGNGTDLIGPCLLPFGNQSFRMVRGVVGRTANAQIPRVRGVHMRDGWGGRGRKRGFRLVVGTTTIWMIAACGGSPTGSTSGATPAGQEQSPASPGPTPPPAPVPVPAPPVAALCADDCRASVDEVIAGTAATR